MRKFACKKLFALSTVKRLLCLLFVCVIAIHILLHKVWTSSSLMEYFSTEDAKFLSFWKEDSAPTSVHSTADVHTEDGSLGHEDLESVVHGKDGIPKVAIGSAITSNNQRALLLNELPTKFLLFSKLLPSFCKTASSGFIYHFYLAFDATDQFFRNPVFQAVFIATFENIASNLCRHLGTVSLHLVQCNHTGKPAWAQNDAMLEAYLDNVDYFYRINDDIVMQTDSWTQVFVDVLNGLDPPNVGVVGPNHTGGNIMIITFDFVHRTHLDIFGFYYPRIFTDWYADGWITRTYRPTRCIKVSSVHLDHTVRHGSSRYTADQKRESLQAPRVESDKVLLNRYINYTQIRDSIKVDGRRVISMSLYGSNPKYTWGAIRNAQIAPIFFPGWKLRFYVTSRSSKAADVRSWLVPKRILKKLKQLGAEIAYVKTKSIAPVFWRYLVIDDQTVDYFIVRDTDSRLSDRDATAVNDWLDHHDLKSDLNSLHCIRDHPDHANVSIVEGLWGGNRETIQRMLRREFHNISNGSRSARNNSPHKSSAFTIELLIGRKSLDSFGLLGEFLWSMLSSNAYCHDSVSCGGWTNSRRFPVERNIEEYLGQKYDEHQEPVKTNSDWTKRIGIGCSQGGRSWDENKTRVYSMH